MDASKFWLFLKANRAAPVIGDEGIGDGGAPGFFDSDERLKALSAAGELLERLSKVVDFKVFRGELEAPCRARTGPRAAGRPMTRC
jgi:hypothetical protein